MLRGIAFVEIRVGRFHEDAPTTRHGIAGVDRQVHEDLVDLARIRQHGTGARIQVRDDFDVVADQPG